MRSIIYCSCNEKQQTVIPYLTFPHYSWLYGPQLHSLFVSFPLLAKNFSLERHFRSFFHILYSSLYIREKTGLGRTACTTWEVGMLRWCCGNQQQHLLFFLQTTSNTPFASLTAAEYWSWGFQNTIHFNFKIFFLNGNSWFRNDWMPS